MGKIGEMDVATLDEELREARLLQIKQNEERVEMIRKIVYTMNPEEAEPEGCAEWLLANLMHLCEAEGWSFDDLVERARAVYGAESGDVPCNWIIFFPNGQYPRYPGADY